MDVSSVAWNEIEDSGTRSMAIIDSFAVGSASDAGSGADFQAGRCGHEEGPYRGAVLMLRGRCLKAGSRGLSTREGAPCDAGSPQKERLGRTHAACRLDSEEGPQGQ